MKENTKREILLESGTNEMEILEFYLGEQSFGLNVQKLIEIIPYDEKRRTAIPESPPSVLGVFEVRGQSIPLIDLGLHLQKNAELETTEETRKIVLVCKFNKRTNAFLVDGVNQIHRQSWNDVVPMPFYLDQYRPRFTGSVSIDSREILIVDLEHVVSEVDPDLTIDQHGFGSGTADNYAVEDHQMSRESVSLMLAEDSSIIRLSIQKVLTDSGYKKLEIFPDGDDCYEAIRNLLNECNGSEEELLKHLDLLITDIEMPKMDGLTLCRKIREELGLKNLKIVMFSSLITEQMAHKCDSVGANGYMSKPEIKELISMVDTLVFSTEIPEAAA
ncbi:MAG: chemotaxis protein CheV [Deltaproteobacteria bacterium]|nr:chemotaxis protein CheV [Deltaproteobacteria bacterium]